MSIEMFSRYANTIGVTGVFLVLLSYALLQLGKMSSDSIRYSLLNTVGSVLILYSLYFHWNLASVIIEISWLIISIYGLVRGVRIKAPF